MRLLSLLLVAAACGRSASPAPVEPVAAPGPAAAEPEVSDDPDAELMAAADAYARANAAKGVELTLEVHARDGDFALLLVEPVRDDADGALLFMKQEAGAWKGLGLGTGIDCADFAEQGVPAKLCDSLR